MKKVLLSSVAALAVFATAAPAFASDPRTWTGYLTDNTVKPAAETDKGDNNRFGNTPDAVIAGKTEAPITIKTADTNKHVRVTVLDGGGRPVPGATIDFMLNGFAIGSAVTDQSGDAEAPRLFNQGDVVEYRVGTTATDFKELVTATGSVTVTADMYTNGSVTLPYKLDDRAATINTNSKEVKASDNNQSKEEAKKAENKGGEAAKAGKASSAQAGKALPKTSAVK